MGRSSFLALAFGIGCGGASEATVREPAAAPVGAPPDAGADLGVDPVTSSPVARPAPPERPFAPTRAEAKRLIGAQLDAHKEAVRKCIVDYLVKNDAWYCEGIDFAIDHEGTLVGVVVSCPKKENGKDPELGAPFELRAYSELTACVTTALHDAMFPKRRSGIITVREEWEGF